MASPYRRQPCRSTSPPSLPSFPMHTLRHLYVTTLLHGSVDKQTVADLAGHGDTSFLERTYCHPQVERKLEAARVISGIIPCSVEDKSA